MPEVTPSPVFEVAISSDVQFGKNVLKKEDQLAALLLYLEKLTHQFNVYVQRYVNAHVSFLAAFGISVVYPKDVGSHSCEKVSVLVPWHETKLVQYRIARINGDTFRHHLENIVGV